MTDPLQAVLCWHKCSGKWLAQIKIDGSTKYLGIRDTREEAAALYADVAIRHFGQFVRRDV